jgi:hypothetical protein
MRLLFSFIAVALCLAGSAQAMEPSAAVHAADVKAIQVVVDQFKAAIISHNGQSLASLFLQDHDSWLSVADEAAWARVKARSPQARKVTPSSWKKFSEFIQNTSKPVEERFYNVRIDTNGAVASVWFDFDFLLDGKVTNRGSESWQMVRAEDGWKISAMLYSEGN